MNETAHVGTFFLIFAVVLAIYSLILVVTGDENWLPLRTQYTVAGPADVRRVGRITLVVAVVIAALALLLRFLAH